MPLGVPLITLRRLLRAEVGASLNPLQGIAAQQSLDLILERQQSELWDAYNWRHLRIWRDVPLVAGQGAYNYPEDLAYEQVITVWFAGSVSERWRPLTYGITTAMIPPRGAMRGTPRYWDNVEPGTYRVQPNPGDPDLGPMPDPGPGAPTISVGQFALLPVPTSKDAATPTSQLLRLEGQAQINPLVADTDKCVLDSRLITLFAAAEILANQKSEGAGVKLQKAQNYLRQLLKNQGAEKRVNRNMGGTYRFGNDPDKFRALVPYLDYIPSS